MGLCLGSPSEGYLVDKVSWDGWDMYYRWRESDLLSADMDNGVCDSTFNRNFYSVWSLYSQSMAMCMHEGMQADAFSWGPAEDSP